MNLAFTNGTDRQQGLVRAAVALATYDWNRLDSTVTFSFVTEGSLDTNPGDNFVVFANTTWSSDTTDGCGRASSATVKVLNTLDDPDRTGIFSGEKFYMETVIHELGHCVQSKFGQGDIQRLSAALGFPVDDWNDPAKPWAARGSEAWAESFKDVFLPRPYRKFDDRANYRLTDTDGSYGLFCSVLDQLCPCATPVEDS